MKALAFTTTYESRSLRLVNDVVAENGGQSVTAAAKWGTGASSTCVSFELAEALGLVRLVR